MRARVKKMKVLVVAVLAAALAMGVAGTTFARDAAEVLTDCTRLGYSFEACCLYAGGEYHATQTDQGLREWCTWSGKSSGSSDLDGAEQPSSFDSHVGSTSESYTASATPTPPWSSTSNTYGGSTSTTSSR